MVEAAYCRDERLRRKSARKEYLLRNVLGEGPRRSPWRVMSPRVTHPFSGGPLPRRDSLRRGQRRVWGISRGCYAGLIHFSGPGRGCGGTSADEVGTSAPHGLPDWMLKKRTGGKGLAITIIVSASALLVCKRCQHSIRATPMIRRLQPRQSRRVPSSHRSGFRGWSQPPSQNPGAKGGAVRLCAAALVLAGTRPRLMRWRRSLESMPCQSHCR